MSYKNNEGYPDPTAGKAVRLAGRMPHTSIMLFAF